MESKLYDSFACSLLKQSLKNVIVKRCSLKRCLFLMHTRISGSSEF